MASSSVETASRSASTPTPTSHMGPVNQSGMFHRNIILDFAIAFLAVFVTFMVGQFVWKWYGRQRAQLQADIEADFWRRHPPRPVQKPRPTMHDVKLGPACTSSVPARWDCLQPISAQTLVDVSKDSRSSSPFPPVVSRLTVLRNALLTVPGNDHAVELPTPPPDPTFPLRTGVIICMPTQRSACDPYRLLELATCDTE
ncbi:hypothetical protein BKA62DRAFT_689692 [Auriculariales sp. MPI-PUGE-AT-0066]|nr:hypothetical protein BKA62DRAFT_689692 [Auriculariales sp. MPI-PUGE-AT-0066]